MGRDWRFAGAVAVLTLIAIVRVASTHRVFAATVDEPIHLASGYEWFSGKLTLDMTHPPLARVLGALPLRLQHLPDPEPTNMVDRGNQLLYAGDHYVKNLARARMGNLLLLALGIVSVALWARRMFSPGVGIAAAALFTSHPLVLAHAGLLTTDLAVTATLPLALLALDLYLEQPTMRRGAFLGLALALGVLSKFSFVVFFVPCVVVVLLVRRPLRARWATGALALAIAFLTIWAGYRFDVRRPADVVEHGHEMMEWAAPAPLKPIARILGNVPIPAPTLFLGMAQVKLHDMLGHDAYLLGRESRKGWWYYFPVVFFFKSPLPWLILAAWGAVTLAWTRNRGGVLVVLLSVAIMLAAMTTTLNIGARHVLPVIPPLCVVAGFAVVDGWQRGRSVIARSAVTALAGWLFVGVALAHPNYLSWFNGLAQPDPSRIAVDSNLDWGQDVLRLSRVVREKKIGELHTAIINCTRPDRHGIHAVPLVPHQKVSGWVAVSESTLRLAEDSGDYDWLRAYRPAQRVGTSIRLYFIP